MITKYNTITTNKTNTDLKIGLFSDIHYSNIFEKEKFELIYNNLKENKPDYICIPGDIIDMTNILDKKENQNEYLDFFKKIQNIAPIIIALGNHDFVRIEKKKRKKEYNLEWYKKLNNLDNVTILHNNILEEKEIRFIGYTLPYDYYYTKTPYESKEILIKNFNEKMPPIDNKKFNILLCHSPIHIIDDKVIKNIKSLKNIRLILSGHMHNGMIPKTIDKIFGGTFGLIYPSRKLFPKYARNMVEKKIEENIISMIITGGITKVQESAPQKLHFINKLYQPQINYIIIKTTKNND